MEISIYIPDEIAEHMLPQGDPAREVLELSVLSALRHGRLFESEAASLLGFKTRFQLWEWLKRVDPDGGNDTVESVSEEIAALHGERYPSVNVQQA